MRMPLPADRYRESGNRALPSFRTRKETGCTYSDGHCDEGDGVMRMDLVEDSTSRFPEPLRTDHCLCKPPKLWFELEVHYANPKVTVKGQSTLSRGQESQVIDTLMVSLMHTGFHMFRST
jgi:hypothetical protein